MSSHQDDSYQSFYYGEDKYHRVIDADIEISALLAQAEDYFNCLEQLRVRDYEAFQAYVYYNPLPSIPSDTFDFNELPVIAPDSSSGRLTDVTQIKLTESGCFAFLIRFFKFW